MNKDLILKSVSSFQSDFYDLENSMRHLTEFLNNSKGSFHFELRVSDPSHSSIRSSFIFLSDPNTWAHIHEFLIKYHSILHDKHKCLIDDFESYIRSIQ